MTLTEGNKSMCISFVDLSQYTKDGTLRIIEEGFFSHIRNLTLTEILDWAFSFLGNPPLFISKRFILYVPPDSHFTDTAFLNVLKGTDPLCQEPHFLQRRQEFLEKNAYYDAPLLLDYPKFGVRYLIDKIMVDGNITAHIELPESNVKFSQSDALYLHLICKYISRNIASKSVMGDFRYFQFERMFAAQLSREPDDLSSMVWTELGWENSANLKKPSLYIAILRSGHSEFDLRLTQETLQGIPCSSGIKYHGDIVYLCFPTTSDQDQKMKAALTRLTKYGSVALSGRFFDHKNMRRHYIQAIHTLEAGIFLHGPGKFYDYTSTSVETFLFDAVQHIQVDQYASAKLKDLLKTDQKNGSDFYNTLKCYLSCNGDKQRTCEELGIHRNTLYYRLNKICTVLELESDIEEEQYMLQLAVKITSLISVLNDKGGNWS